MKRINGGIQGSDLRMAIIVGRFNELVTNSLCDAAVNSLLASGVSEENINVLEVPGAFEVPGLAAKLAESEKYDAIICLGAVIRGDTPHFEQVVSGSTAGMVQVAVKYGLPVINGILTTDTVEQALNRAGLKAGNKGWDAAATAVEMANLYKQV
jgi:6,7-dimethyl-8-ribityllumazine synthase